MEEGSTAYNYDSDLATLTFADFIERMFRDISVVEMYAVVQDARNTVGFTAPPTNDQVMAQNAYVTQQYRKFRSSLRPAIMELAEADKVQELHDTMVAERQELDAFPKDERSALYYTVRDAWLGGLINACEAWMYENGNGGEDGR